MGSSELIPYFALPVHAAFTLPIELSLSQPTSSCPFTLLIPSSIPLRLCGAELPTGLKPRQSGRPQYSLAFANLLEICLHR